MSFFNCSFCSIWTDEIIGESYRLTLMTFDYLDRLLLRVLENQSSCNILMTASGEIQEGVPTDLANGLTEVLSRMLKKHQLMPEWNEQEEAFFVSMQLAHYLLSCALRYPSSQSIAFDPFICELTVHGFTDSCPEYTKTEIAQFNIYLRDHMGHLKRVDDRFLSVLRETLALLNLPSLAQDIAHCLLMMRSGQPMQSLNTALRLCNGANMSTPQKVSP